MSSPQIEAEFTGIYERAIGLLESIKSKSEDKIKKLPDIFLDKIFVDPFTAPTLSNHVNISVSGWMSKEVNKNHHWQGLYKYYQ